MMYTCEGKVWLIFLETVFDFNSIHDNKYEIKSCEEEDNFFSVTWSRVA